MDVTDARWQVGLTFAPVKDAHVVASADETRNHVRAEEASAAEDEDTGHHAGLSRRHRGIRSARENR